LGVFQMVAGLPSVSLTHETHQTEAEEYPISDILGLDFNQFENELKIKENAQYGYNTDELSQFIVKGYGQEHDSYKFPILNNKVRANSKILLIPQLHGNRQTNSAENRRISDTSPAEIIEPSNYQQQSPTNSSTLLRMRKYHFTPYEGRFNIYLPAMDRQKYIRISEWDME